MGSVVVSALVETVFPRVCPGCGMRDSWLCEYCEGSVPPATQPVSCGRCGVPNLRGRCGCANLDPVISVARSAFVYDGWVASAVHRTKYQGESGRASHLAECMVALLPAFGAVDGLIPVPLHVSRERERGFNQSLLIARRLSQLAGISVLPVLERTRRTLSQTTLSGEERQINVDHAFRADPDWVPRPGGRYLLIDDVRTTGATLNACAEALKRHRPAMLGVLTFALDMHMDDVEALRAYEVSVATGVSPVSPAGAPLLTAPTSPLRGPHRAP